MGHWTHPLPSWAYLLLVAVVLLALPVTAWRSRAVDSRPVRVLLLCLRATVFALLLWVLAGPVDLRSTPFAPKPVRHLFLLDNSESMDLNTPLTRRQAARRILRRAMANRQVGRRLELWTFDAELHEPDSQPPEAGRSTHLGTALSELVRHNRDTGVTDVVVFSDGRIHDRTQLSRAVVLARRSGIPVSVCPVGEAVSFANVSIETCVVERQTAPGTRLPIRAHVHCRGVEGQRCELRLAGPDGAEPVSVPFVAEEGMRPIDMVVDVGHKGGRYALTLTELPGEITYRDNRYEFDVEVRERKRRVLYMEGTISRNRAWGIYEYQFVENALEEAGDTEVVSLIVDQQRTVGGRLYRVGDSRRGYPDSRKELFEYDVVICSDINRAIFTEDQLRWTVELVAERGGGFCMVGGYTSFNSGGYDQTVWERLIPVDMAQMREGYDNTPFFPVVPQQARSHPILQLVPDRALNDRVLDLMPPFFGTNLVRRPKPAATVLAEHPGRAMPLICIQPYGKGRTMAFLSDTTWGWGKAFESEWGTNLLSDGTPPEQRRMPPAHTHPGGPPPEQGGDNTYFRKFWVNTVEWLSKNSLAYRNARLLVNTERITYRPGDDVRLRAAVLATEDTPPDAFNVTARLDPVEQRAKPLEFAEDRAEHVGSLTIPASFAGRRLRVVFRATGTGRDDLEETVEIRVLQRGKEFREPEPDHPLLEELARATGGKVIRAEKDLLSLLEERTARLPKPRVFPVPKWDRWWLWALLVALLSVEWVVRRLA